MAHERERPLEKSDRPRAERVPSEAHEIVSLPGIIPLADDEFRDFRELIHRSSGIHLGDSKKQLVASRLAKRLRVHGLASYREYHEWIARRDPDGTEMGAMLNAITTNKTEFFRERHHFDFLSNQWYSDCLARAADSRERHLRIWSAGCSTGEEPYSVAMTILDRFPPSGGWSFEILATDLDTQVLAIAQQGVYREEVAAAIPAAMKQRFMRRGKGPNAGMVQVSREVRQCVTFRPLNLVCEPWGHAFAFDVILCRNVMIYFDRETQRSLTRRLAGQLRPGGYLMLGHSEMLQGLEDDFETLRGTIHRRRARPERVSSPARKQIRVEPAEPVHRSIHIGGVQASAEPAVLRTVLGSCVCACVFDPVARIGGMNHFLLPDGLADEAVPTRYGVHAMEVLINELLKLGADRRRLQAKAFGAAHVLHDAGLGPQVPRKNARFIKEFLEKEGIPLLGSRLGGSRPVEVLFATDTARARVRALGESIAHDLVREETRHDLEVRRALVVPAPGSVELFGEAA